MQQFLEAGATLSFAGTGRKPVYALIERTLRGCQYPALSKKDHRAPLLGQGQRTQPLANHPFDRPLARARRPRAARFERRRFPRRYTPDDIARLAAVDAAHEGSRPPPSVAFSNASAKSTARPHTNPHLALPHLQPTAHPGLSRTPCTPHHARRGGEHRRAAQTRSARPGRLVAGRHGAQGDTDSSKGLYHINAVDTVTQWEVVGCCETISEAHLKPVLEALLHQFPFLVRGFHSDNGSEFLNYRVARLLEKMRVSSPNRVLIAAPTMRWWKARTARWCASTSDTSRSPPSTPKSCNLLRGRFQSVFELSPPVWIRDRGDGVQRQAPASLPAGGLPHAVRKVAFARQRVA